MVVVEEKEVVVAGEIELHTGPSHVRVRVCAVCVCQKVEGLHGEGFLGYKSEPTPSKPISCFKDCQVLEEGE